MTTYDIHRWEFTTEDLTEFSNRIKEALIDQMSNEGLLTRPVEELLAEYAIVLQYKRNLLGRFIDSVLQKPEEKRSLHIHIVKRLKEQGENDLVIEKGKIIVKPAPKEGETNER